jgi:hypothetical protein
MNCASNPSKSAAPARRDVIVEFPVAGGRHSSMNHVRVSAYGDSLGRVVSMPSSRNHAVRAKLIIDDARYGEDKPTVDMDVVVHFAKNNFDGDSFGLALALADKLARYGAVRQTGRVVATGVVGPQGEVTAVGAFFAKVAYLEQILQAGDLFVYPTHNAATIVCEALQRLQNNGVVLRAVEHLEQLGDLWHSEVALSASERVSASQASEVTQRQGGVPMPYTAEISRTNPSCLLFLIDQSGSMSDPVGGEPGRSKADRLADAINRLLYELIIRCTKNQSEGPRHYYAEAVRTLGTVDGNVLLFNLHLSSHPGAPILYPENESSLPDQFARQLFQMSSLLPPHIREAARSAGYSVGPQARGFVFNADIVEVIKFLDLGTRAELR